ncbi:MAG TPA: glycosyltransferase family 2 protein [Galbitalea sp.]|nr:glycosyltransferase family 2 protein [Galbitalea sp.]
MNVAVALCTRNGAAHIEQQILSILNQSVLPTEVVISDDASTDNTVALIRGMFDRHPKPTPQLIVLENAVPLGVTANFEQALRSCTCELIALSDQDDIWHTDRIRVAALQFESSPSLELLHTDARLVAGDGEPLGVSLFEALDLTRAEVAALESGQSFAPLLKRNLITGATTMVRKALVARAIPFPAPWVHDEWLAIVASAADGLRMIPNRLIDYRQHGANEIGVRKLGAPGKIRRIFEPRGGRGDYLLLRAQVMYARLEGLGSEVSPAYLELARGKVEHQRARAALSASRPRRWVPVLREVTTGRYRSFSRGAGDILRDLFQPA